MAQETILVMELFVIELELKNEQIVIEYTTLDECLSDSGLRALFDEGLVSGCMICCHGKRITGLPVMTWGKLREQVMSNSTTILHCHK